MRFKTNDELRVLADEFVHNKFFSNFHLRDPKDMEMVFMCFIFLDEDTHKRIKEDKLCMVYEYYDKAGPRGINGYPMFMSMCMIFEDDFKIFLKYKDAIIAIEKQKDEVLKNMDIENTIINNDKPADNEN